jgi:cell division protease FtsH
MNVRNLAIWGAIALLVIGMAVAMGGNPETASAKRAKLSEIYTLVDNGQVAEATLGDDQIIVKTTDGNTMVSELRALDMSTQDYLRDHNVPFTVDADSGRNNLPILLILGVWIFFMRQMQGGSGGPWALASRRPSF